MNQPAIEPEDKPNIPIPPRHRALSPGEQLRRGDKIFNVDAKSWVKISEELRGANVPETPESGGKHYCRPIDPLSQVWYVDRRGGRGSKDALGGPSDPFDTLENAQEAIAKTAAEMDREPFGAIRDHRGALLVPYDLPEPPQESDYFATRPKIAPMNRRAGQFGTVQTNPPNDPFKQNDETKAGESMKPAEEPCEGTTFLDVVDQLEQAVLDLLVEIRCLKNECM